MKTIKFTTTVRRQKQRVGGKDYITARITSKEMLGMIGKKVEVTIEEVC